MADELYLSDQFGRIDQCYNAWHRTQSLKRFLPESDARRISCIDVDATLFLEYSNCGRFPLLLLETAMERGQNVKPTTVLTNLAKMADLPAMVVLYAPSREGTMNPADPRWPDIIRFRIKRLWPDPEAEWRRMKPAEYAARLRRAREWSARRLLDRFPILAQELNRTGAGLIPPVTETHSWIQ